MFHLDSLGWDDFFASRFLPFAREGWLPGRVASESQDRFQLYTERGEVAGRVSGKLRFAARARDDFPAVGDWVAFEPSPDGAIAIIHGVLPRKSKFSRRAAGTVACEQIVAANVDVVFLVSALNHDFNVRRIERYLILARESGALPVVVLNKADLCEDVASPLEAVRAIAPGVPVHPVTGIRPEGLKALDRYLAPGRTAALLGSSGVGKSTLVNAWLGREAHRVQEARATDDRGRHTTTSRQLRLLPSGALLVDTPGMREIQLWGSEAGLGAFEDVAAIAVRCRFRDCRHDQEPGCAVKAAVEAGTLDPGRLGSYRKTGRELKSLTRRRRLKAR